MTRDELLYQNVLYHDVHFLKKFRHLFLLLIFIVATGCLVLMSMPYMKKTRAFSVGLTYSVTDSLSDLRSIFANVKDKDDWDKCHRCLRPHAGDGVEDLLCMEKPEYIQSVKNPCYYDDSFAVRCLPYFHILGCAKCATTDLADRLSVHPDVVDPRGGYDKETLWWSWRRYGIMGYKTVPIRNFEYYTNYFKPLTKEIWRNLANGHANHSQLVTFDGSPPDFWDYRGWQLLPQNHGRREPCVFTPQLMQHIYRDPKFLLLFRNPTDRLYSDYFFLRLGQSPREFDLDVKKSINILRNCQKKRTMKECFYSKKIYKKLPTRIHYGCYSLYLTEWFRVFPRHHFHIMKTEEYTKDVWGHLSQIFKFLDLPQLPESFYNEVTSMKKARVTLSKSTAGEMLPETRALLDNFYTPCNRELADMLADDKYLWKRHL